MKKIAEILLLCCAIALLMGADTAEARFQRLGAKMMCTCGDCTYMLLECNHVGCPNSTKMIAQLRALTGAAASGPGSSENAGLAVENDDQAVLNWFRKTWGVTAVVEPATHGLELWAWLLPPAALGLGLILAIVVIRNWRTRRVQPAANASLDPHLDALAARARRETEI